jgi:hypothetical protein
VGNVVIVDASAFFMVMAPQSARAVPFSVQGMTP